MTLMKYQVSSDVSHNTERTNNKVRSARHMEPLSKTHRITIAWIRRVIDQALNDIVYGMQQLEARYKVVCDYWMAVVLLMTIQLPQSCLKAMVANEQACRLSKASTKLKNRSSVSANLYHFIC